MTKKIKLNVFLFSMLSFLLACNDVANYAQKQNDSNGNSNQIEKASVSENVKNYKNIREVDFNNFLYKLPANLKENNSRCLDERGLKIEKGEARENENINKVSEVIYGDLTNDGQEEAVIKFNCGLIGRGITEAYIYTLINGTPQFLHLVEGGSVLDGAILELKILAKGVLEVKSIGSLSGKRENVKKFTDTYIIKNSSLIKTGKTKSENYKLN